MLVERGLAGSRAKAQALILAGQVKAGDEIILKVGHQIPIEKEISISAGQKYVSRGGEKLEGALDDFKLSPSGLVCVDVGASTGGFTDCLLQRGAKQVIAIDVGKGQLDLSLRNDPRVISLEETHILHVDPDRFGSLPSFGVIDASFISLKNILSHVKTLLAADATLLAMVKPQFEVGAKFLKKGVVRSDEARVAAVDGVIEFAKQQGFYYLGQTPARIKGPKGNQEHFIHLKTTHGQL